MAEAGAGIKAGSAIVKAIRTAPQTPQWPNMHESLVTLNAILEEWCAAAADTSRIIENESERRLGRAQRTRYIAVDGRQQVIYDDSNAFSLSAGLLRRRRRASRFIRDTTADIASVMQSRAELIWRWRGSKRRAASRRGLRTLMLIYFPELLTDFIDATEDRVQFAKRNTTTMKALQGYSDQQLDDLYQEAQRTHLALVEVSDKLADLIEETFPLNPNK